MATVAATAVSRSVFNSRRGSRHLEDLRGEEGGAREDETVSKTGGQSGIASAVKQGHSRTQSSVRTASSEQQSRQPEDKIAIQDPFSNEELQRRDGDSMKFALDPLSSSRKHSGTSFGADFSQAFFNDAHFKTFGLDGTLLTNPAQKKIPAGSEKTSDVVNPIDWKTNLFELESASDKTRKSTMQPGLILYDENIAPTDAGTVQHSRKQSIERSRMPDDSWGKEVVASSRPISTVSTKMASVPYSYGSDAPEVAAHYGQHQRQHQEPNQQYSSAVARVSHSSRPSRSGDVPNLKLHTRQNSEHRTVHQNTLQSRYNPQVTSHQQQHGAQFQQQLRPMASSPALNHSNGQTPVSAVSARPWMGRRPSATSLRSTVSNINKPLPPEPPGLPTGPPIEAATANIARYPPGLVNRRPMNLNESEPASPIHTQFATKDSRGRTAHGTVNVRSRYATKNLDALDDAFQRSATASPLEGPRQAPFTAQDMAYRDQLDTIRESPRNSELIDINAPLQIRRGPMDMRPSRRPPPTPNESRGRSPNRDASRSGVSVPTTPRRPSIPIMATIAPIDTSVPSVSNLPSRTPDTRNPDSPTMYRGGGKPKVKQLLGENPVADASQEFDDPQNAADMSQPMTRKGSLGTPYRMGGSDAQFDEIRRRLELLSPATASESSLLSSQAVGQMLSNSASLESPSTAHNGNAMIDFINLDDSQVASNTITSRPKSSSPVELPTELSRSPAIQQQAIEMDATEISTSSPEPATFKVKPATPLVMIPPPIPESPTYEMRRTDSAGRHSMLSSGSGRTKSLKSVKSIRSARSAKARSLSSLAVSEIQELYAGLPSPKYTLASRRTSRRPSVTAEEDIPEIPPVPEVATMEELEELEEISADVAERVLYQILRNLHEPEDLFNASLISHGFQRVFRRHDTKLLRNALWYTSGPAWEYLEMHLPIDSETGQLMYPVDKYREKYVESMRSMSSLKSMILRHCGSSILSRATTVLLCASSTKESAPVDDALWRIWTFCRIFGEDVDRREDLEMQKRWLKGQTMEEAQMETHLMGSGHRGKYSIKEYPTFAYGNHDGLTPEELIRMGEIWLCLRKLVRGYQGRRREAREFGVFEGIDIARNDFAREDTILDEWTIHLLSLAPGTVPEILAPKEATADNFISAEQLGFTSWTPPSRKNQGSGFLTGPICSVLEEWLAQEGKGRLHPAPRPEGPVQSSSDISSTTSPPSRQTVEGFVTHIRSSHDTKEFKDLLNKRQHHDPAGKLLGVPTHGLEMAVIELPKSKEGKKIGFGKFIRLPSRAPTANVKSRSKALMPGRSSNNNSANSSPLTDGLSPPISPPNGSASRFDLIRNLTTRTRKNSAAQDEIMRQTGLAQATSSGQESGSSPEVVGLGVNGFPSASNQYDSPQATYSNSSMPVSAAADRLLEMGYEQNRVEKVLNESGKNGTVNFDKVLKKVKKTKVLQDKLMRLDRMG